MQMVDGFPRRSRVDLFTRPELRIHDAKHAVEAAGAHPLLTDALNLLHQAQNKVADFVELGCQGGECKHASDCAVHNGEHAGPCDCGADWEYEAERPAKVHGNRDYEPETPN